MKYFLTIVFLTSFNVMAQTKATKSDKELSLMLNALSRFEFAEDKQYIGKKDLDTLYYNDTVIKAIGYFAVDKQDIKTDYKAGLWKEFYENGELKSVGNYNIQYLLVASSSNKAIIYNQYKTGEWIFYYPNGQVKAKGRYRIVRTPVTTGVDNQYTKAPVITDEWFFYSSDGKPLGNKKEVMGEIE